MTLLVGAVVVAALAAACSPGPNGPSTGTDASLRAALDGSVPAAHVQEVADALALARVHCPDLASATTAGAAVADAVQQLGLKADDPRWAHAGPALAAGAAAHRTGPCRAQVTRWLASSSDPSVVVTTTNPPASTTVPSTTTTTSVAVPKVTRSQGRQIRIGMSLSEAQAIAGSPGRRTPVGVAGSGRDLVVAWPGCCLPFASLRVTVHDGVVIAVNRFNLTEPRP